ncbi:MAG TPA: OsmC family protein [Gemmatimonadales bacterium]|nr:OsmC family protein [Gemmatimonadales bacterium]
MAAPFKQVSASWLGRSMVFRGEVAGRPPVVIDGETDEGPSPMDTLLLALATCSGSDVVLILKKKRLELRDLRIEVRGERREEEPRRFLRINLVYHVAAPGATESAVRQAIDLSLEKYCSVAHSLQPDIRLTYELHLRT